MRFAGAQPENLVVTSVYVVHPLYGLTGSRGEKPSRVVKGHKINLLEDTNGLA